MARSGKLPVQPADANQAGDSGIAAGRSGVPPRSSLQLQVSGHSDPLTPPPPRFAELGVAVTVRDAVRPAATRAGEPPKTIEAGSDDIVELTLRDGARLWIRADEVEARLGGAAARGSRPGVIQIGTVLPLDERERGAGAWAIEGLRVLGVDLPAGGARRVAERIETKLVPEPGLYRWRGDTVRPTDRITAALPESDLPWLVFLHGTASNTMGSFGALPQHRERWIELERRYGERILALEHKTLTESPIENALALLKLLPAGARLHFVSHSRGGLVGELLCRAHLHTGSGDSLATRPSAFDEHELALFQDENRAGQRTALGEVERLLSTRRPRVERFVRVACPARGTSLAGERLDRWLNLVTDVVGFAAGTQPVLGEIYELLSALVVATVKERARPETLPGLEAMVPERSPLLRILNRPGVVVDSDLSIVKGDIEPSGMLRRLAIWFTDAFYAGDHDLVVDSLSMEGGLERKSPARVFFDQGYDVDHFSYFRNGRSVERIVAALLRDDKDSAGFVPLTVPPGIDTRGRPPLSTRGTRPRPVVFVLPGITGSHLKVDASRIWIDLFRLATGGLKRLGIERADVTVDEPVWRYYADLCAFLDRSHEVRPWSYDWRRPIDETALAFADEIDDALSRTELPVRIVAHSMGGLVARAALARDGTWKRFQDRTGSRLVMLGTPNGGSFSIPMMLMARNTLMGHLAILDFTMSRREHQAIIARFGGALAMLPAGESVTGDSALDASDIFTEAWWQKLQARDPSGGDWVLPRGDDLVRARTFRAAIDAAKPDPDRMFYVAGQAVTIAGVTIDPAEQGERRILFTRSQEGDGQVLWKTGIPAGIRAWYTPAVHGDLARYEPAFPAIQEILEQGRTDRLPDTPVQLTRGLAEPEPIAREHVPIFPHEADLVLGATGGPVKGGSRRETLPRISLSIMNGDLSFASHAVLVGHYMGDTIAGTEEHVDRALGGRLRHRYDLGIYPGAVGSADVVLDSRVKPPGAVIMGLGNIAELTPGRLREALVRGLTTFAAAAGEAEPSTPGETRRLEVSPVLIGSGEGGLSIDETLAALLHAVLEAQRRLHHVRRPTFRRVEIVELVEQRALTIWHTLDRLLALPDFRAALDLEPEVRTARGGRRRLALRDDRTWWRTVQITARKPSEGSGILDFVGIAGRARAQGSMTADNRAMADLFVAQAIEGQARGRGAAGDGPADTASPARALFELLWPPELKEANTDDSNLRLVLDEQTARYPWELMDDRRPWLGRGGGPDMTARKPPAARFGVLRQLIRSSGRNSGAAGSSGRRALVIGDPRGGTPAKGFAPLPGARAEAEAVATLLRGRGYEVTWLDDTATPDMVVRHLLTQAWSIVHIAAHGVVDHRFEAAAGGAAKGTPGPAHTGIVLGDGVVLGPALFQQMPVTPDLVFVNCCHLATVDPEAEAAHRLERRPELAASVAVQLIDMGTRAVIAAGWAVDDAAAALFARSLYEQLLDGSSYGNAVRFARERAHDAHAHSTTWGAYQCYGEPDWRLDPRGLPMAFVPPPHYAAPVEALADVEQIREAANVGIGRDTEALKLRLREVESTIKARAWLDRADLRSALGDAHAELGQLDEAIGHYEAALGLENAQVPVRTIEQLANLRVRKAGQIWRNDAGRRAEALQQIEKARTALENLTKLAGSTSERLSLQGGAWKRQAQIVDEADRAPALEKMRDCYEKAAKLARQAALPNAYYPDLMHRTTELLLQLRQDAEPSRPLCEALGGLRQELGRADGDADDFWRAIASVDAQLGLAVAERRLTRAEEERLARAYCEVWSRAGSDLTLTSVIGQFQFLEDMLAGGVGPISEGRLDLRDGLARIRVELDEARKRGVTAGVSGPA